MKKLLLIATTFIVINVTAQNVGIGTTTPAFKLDVNGNLNIKGDSSIYISGTKVLSINGNNNLFIGISAGIANTTGNKNIGIGAYSFYNNSAGYNNAAIGFNSLFSNTTGYRNTASGCNALFLNTTGTDNIANGSYSLEYNTTGSYNTACGSMSLFYNTTGSYNTANGFNSLTNNTTGNNNIGIGYLALYSNTIGVQNTACGWSALYSNVSGNNNTAMGISALSTNTTGIWNTAMGVSADVSSGNDTNSTALGHFATITASNQMRFGNSSITSIGGQVGWTTISDARVKTNIQNNVPGLDFILKLNPVTYTIDVATLDKLLRPDGFKNTQTQEESNAKTAKSKIVYTGFIAQDVEATAKNIGYDFSGVDAPKNDKDLYGIRYAEFVVPLVKAIQEQQIQIEQLKKEIEVLKQK